MNEEKVYIEGYVVGFMVDAIGTRKKQIEVSSGETVSIDESFIQKSITPEKVKIPQFVADIIEECKGKNAPIMDIFTEKYSNKRYHNWLMQSLNAYDRAARAYLDGYEVEQEKRYEVSIKASGQYLARNKLKEIQFMFNGACSHFTRKELEEAGFGWVFDCPGIKVEEVDE